MGVFASGVIMCENVTSLTRAKRISGNWKSYDTSQCQTIVDLGIGCVNVCHIQNKHLWNERHELSLPIMYECAYVCIGL